MSVSTAKVYFWNGGTTSILKRFTGYLYSKTLLEMVAQIGTSTHVTLEIHGTVTLTADLNIPDNVTVIMKAGSKITLSGSDMTILYIANCICEGPGPHFSVGSNCWLLFGKQFTAPPVKMFEGSGFANVRFCLGNELITSHPKFDDPTGWVYTTPWSISGGNAVASSASNTLVQTFADTAATYYYWSALYAASLSGTLEVRVGNGVISGDTITAAGLYDKYHLATNTDGIKLTGTNLTATIAAVSARKILGGISEIRTEWWGAVGDGTTDCAAAIQAAMSVAGRYFETPMPHVIRFGPGYFSVGSQLSLQAYCSWVGDPQGTIIKAASGFSGSYFIRNTSPLGGYTSIGSRVRMKLFEHIKLDCSQVATEPFYIFHSDTNFNNIDLRYTRFLGNSSYQHIAMYLDCSTNNQNSLIVSKCAFKDCRSYRMLGTGDVVDLGAVYLVHSADSQNIVFELNDFNCPGRHLVISGANNEVKSNNFQATPYAGIAITARGAFYLPNSAGKGVIAASQATNCVLTLDTAFDASQNHPWFNTESTNRQVLVVFTGGTGWDTKTGLYTATFNTGVGAKTITLTGCNTSTGCSGTPTVTVEFVGGFTTRLACFNNNHVFNNNYIDGSGYRVDLIGVNSSSVNSSGSSSCLFIANDNKSLPIAGCGEFLNDGSAQGVLAYTASQIAGSKASSNQFKISGNYASSFLLNNYCWVYQYLAGKNYGYIRSKIIGAGSYDGTYTTVTIEDYILRSDTTIKILLETTAFRNKQNYWLKSLGTVLASIPA